MASGKTRYLFSGFFYEYVNAVVLGNDAHDFQITTLPSLSCVVELLFVFLAHIMLLYFKTSLIVTYLYLQACFVKLYSW